MTRIGINPARRKTSKYKPSRVTATVLTYIPDLSGYFKQRLDILQLTLTSLQKNTNVPFDLMVFDNGSCGEVVKYLQEQQHNGVINFLLLAKENIGKIGALRIMFNAVPGEIVAYSDDDIFFYPGWLEAQLQILEAFPNVGMVSGIPVRNASKHANHSLEKLLQQPPPQISVSLERRIPDQWEIDWAQSTGRDPKKHIESTQNEKDIVLKTKKNNSDRTIEAIGSANHFQFIAPKNVITRALPTVWRGNLMGSMLEMDEAVDALGYLRLATVDRFTRHIGNVLSGEVVDEARTFGINLHNEIVETAKDTQKTGRHWIFVIPGARRFLTYIYNHIFEILYQ